MKTLVGTVHNDLRLDGFGRIFYVCLALQKKQDEGQSECDSEHDGLVEFGIFFPELHPNRDLTLIDKTEATFLPLKAVLWLRISNMKCGDGPRYVPQTKTKVKKCIVLKVFDVLVLGLKASLVAWTWGMGS